MFKHSRTQPCYLISSKTHIISFPQQIKPNKILKIKGNGNYNAERCVVNEYRQGRGECKQQQQRDKAGKGE